MAELLQQPGELNITVTSKDDLPILLDFDIDLTGYTFTAYVNSTAMTIVETDLANGQVTISLTDTQLTALTPGPHKWYFKWNDGTNDRVVLAGVFTIRDYP